MKFEICQPTTEKEFEAYYHLRWRVLRQPWHQPVGSERDDLEEQCQHFMARDSSGRILGVARLQMNSSSEAQVRFMAVDDDCQGQGVGRQIMEAVERSAKACGANTIILNARENAIPFYQRLGYTKYADGDLLYGEIKHAKMRKPMTEARQPN